MKILVSMVIVFTSSSVWAVKPVKSCKFNSMEVIRLNSTDDDAAEKSCGEVICGGYVRCKDEDSRYVFCRAKSAAACATIRGEVCAGIYDSEKSDSAL